MHKRLSKNFFFDKTRKKDACQLKSSEGQNILTDFFESCRINWDKKVIFTDFKIMVPSNTWQLYQKRTGWLKHIVGAKGQFSIANHKSKLFFFRLSPKVWLVHTYQFCKETQKQNAFIV